MRSLPDTFSPRQRFSYVFSLNAVEYATHWAVYEGVAAPPTPGAAPLYRIHFLSESDPARAGLAGPKLRSRIELICDEHLHPRRYRVMTDSNVNIAAFEERTTLYLPDGSRRELDLDPFLCILGDNIGQLDLFCRLAREELAGGFSGTFFSFGGVTAFEYSLTPSSKGCGWYESAFLERLLIGEDGSLQRFEVPKDGLVAVPADVPLPEWRNDNLLRPPLKYHPPENAGFVAEEISCPAEDVRLGTTVTVPLSGGPHPIVLFIPGSGAKDRHGIAGPVDIGSHEIVDYLSGHGWLGVRYDSRGTGGTELGQGFLEYGFEETVADARAVLECVFGRPDADASQVALVGHSQGALAAVMLARANPRVRALVLLAMAGRKLPEVLADQLRVQARWLGHSAEQLQQQIEELDRFVNVVITEAEWSPERVPARFYAARRHRKWYADHLARDPLAEIRQVRCPVLICQGAKDFQVSLEKDAQPLYQTALEAGVPVEFAVFDELDHFFKPVEGEPHVSQYYVARHVSDAVKDRILEFLDRTVRTR
ncbi:MAG: alpha/beta fold hydrolase [Bryobacteraceae bacterium]|nr:alpha/beta fold hydrolase [Bryobacterales bacterium]MEB2360855.1 alpha/beta fold hydrolase [Bryobacterales bacterium]NUN02659.1 alpha/beta fold hydrolase [Bryobacteraceae bacterium]